VTVVSPDVTARSGAGRTVLALHRDLRIRALERAGFPVVDWQLDTDLDTALETALAHIVQ
jgi:uncharacterized protein (DUF58 family)